MQMVEQDRERFVKQLQQTASDRAIPIEQLSCRGIPGKDGFEVTIKSGGKKRVIFI
jgi:hypothetical protein